MQLKPSELKAKTVHGKIHKLVLHSVTAMDSGNYSCQIKDKKSSSKLTVNEGNHSIIYKIYTKGSCIFMDIGFSVFFKVCIQVVIITSSI